MRMQGLGGEKVGLSVRDLYTGMIAIYPSVTHDTNSTVTAIKEFADSIKDPEFIKSLEKQFGFDKPAYQRFFLMLWNSFYSAISRAVCPLWSLRLRSAPATSSFFTILMLP